MKQFLMELIKKYFPTLEQSKVDKFQVLYPIYEEWNRKINLISRKDFEFFYERHVLYSLAIAALVKFPAGSNVLDVGTGGGFPGIPLAIVFTDVKFHLVDSVAKKIKVVGDIAQQLNLENVTVQCARAESLNNRYNYIVSRAVAPMHQMVQWTSHLIASDRKIDPRPGIFYLKGGVVSDELSNLNWLYRIHSLNEICSEPFFETKLLLHLYK
jgi:16S rRNA (guanine527-N7)-methyltransferase